MRQSSLPALIFALVALAVAFEVPVQRAGPFVPGAVAAEPKASGLSAEQADRLLQGEPLTIVFRRTDDGSGTGNWNWSINSAGEGELTGGRPRKVTLSAEQMGAIRRSLRAERFVALQDRYGPSYLHGGWDTLTVIAGEFVNKTVRFESVSTWAGNPRTLREVAPAARVWVTVAEVLDPDEQVFRERKTLARALELLKK